MADEDDEQGFELGRGVTEGSQQGANTPKAMGHRTFEETPADELHLEMKARSQRNRRILHKRTLASEPRPPEGPRNDDREDGQT